MNDIGDVKGKHILLLQGPIGSFFKRLDSQFRAKGARTFRVGLNAGDEFFSYVDNYTGYYGKEEAWYGFIEEYLQKNKIDKVFLFGDCRFYQSILVQVSEKLGLDIFVFEEGYIRPNYITMERYGVNNYSHIVRNKSFYDFIEPVKLDRVKEVNSSALKVWGSVIIYYFIANLYTYKYKNYKHHRDFSAIKEFFIGLRSLRRKFLYKIKDRKYLDLIKNKFSKKYFFVPLQTHNDFQVLQHSSYASIEKFIVEVLESFQRYANKEHILMFKHHPLDRGRKNYTKFICEYSKKLGIEKRVMVFHDLHLPTCLKNARGTITINSTVGLSSLYHKTPTITLGNAIYDIAGLTNKDKNLKEFWSDSEEPNTELFHNFRHYLIKTTQLNGSFYGCMPDKLK